MSKHRRKDGEICTSRTHLGWYALQLLLALAFAEVANQMLPNFDAYILAPKKGKTEALRKTLTSSYGGASAMLDDGGDDSAAQGPTRTARYG